MRWMDLVKASNHTSDMIFMKEGKRGKRATLPPPPAMYVSWEIWLGLVGAFNTNIVHGGAQNVTKGLGLNYSSQTHHCGLVFSHTDDVLHLNVLADHRALIARVSRVVEHGKINSGKHITTEHGSMERPWNYNPDKRTQTPKIIEVHAYRTQKNLQIIYALKGIHNT